MKINNLDMNREIGYFYNILSGNFGHIEMLLWCFTVYSAFNMQFLARICCVHVYTCIVSDQYDTFIKNQTRSWLVIPGLLDKRVKLKIDFHISQPKELSLYKGSFYHPKQMLNQLHWQTVISITVKPV